MLIICFRSTTLIAFLYCLNLIIMMMSYELHHICNIFMWVLKSAFSKLMKSVIQGVHCETMALIVNVIGCNDQVCYYCSTTDYLLTKEMLSYVCLIQVIQATNIKHLLLQYYETPWNKWNSPSPPAWILTQPLLWDPLNFSSTWLDTQLWCRYTNSLNLNGLCKSIWHCSTPEIDVYTPLVWCKWKGAQMD